MQELTQDVKEGERTNTVKSAIVNFRVDLEALKILKEWDDEDLAAYLHVTPRTIRRMRKDPLTATGKNILLVQQLLKEARKKFD